MIVEMSLKNPDLSSAVAMSILEDLFQIQLATPVNLARWLSDACLGGHVRCIEVLLAHDAPADDLDVLLALACRSGNEDAAMFLLERGASVHPAGIGVDGPMHLACRHNMPGLVTALATAGAKINAIGRNARRPLHYAVKSYSPALVGLLVGLGADADLGDVDHEGPLTLAVKEAQYECAQILLESEEIINIDINESNAKGESPIYVATATNQPDMVRLLLDHGADPDARSHRGDTALHMASERNMLSVMDALIQGNADLNAAHEDSEETPIFVACRRNHEHAIDLLARAGADLNARKANGGTLLHACAELDSDVARVVLTLGVDVHAVDSEGRTALHRAVEKNRVSLVRMLAEAGAFMDQECTISRKTALHVAAEANNSIMVCLLASLGAGLNAQDAMECTPLMLACQKGASDAAAALLGGGAAVDVEALNGYTALHDACAHARPDCIALLIDHGGVDLNAPVGDRQTPLHVACEHGHLEVVRMLLDRGAHVQERDRKVARKNRFNEILGLLGPNAE